MLEHMASQIVLEHGTVAAMGALMGRFFAALVPHVYSERVNIVVALAASRTSVRPFFRP